MNERMYMNIYIFARILINKMKKIAFAQIILKKEKFNAIKFGSFYLKGIEIFLKIV